MFLNAIRRNPSLAENGRMAELLVTIFVESVVVEPLLPRI